MTSHREASAEAAIDPMAQQSRDRGVAVARLRRDGRGLSRLSRPGLFEWSAGEGAGFAPGEQPTADERDHGEPGEDDDQVGRGNVTERGEVAVMPGEEGGVSAR